MEQVMDQGIDVSSYAKALGRRVWTILIVFVLGSVLAFAVAYVLPPVYESTAKILVESQQIPEDLAQATVRQSVAERLELIQQRLMTRENLLEMVNRLALFSDRPDLTPSDKVDRVREATTFESISFNDNPRYRGPTQVSAFTITYSADSGPLAAKVTNQFVTLVLEQNIAARSQRAAETYDFFKQEVERLSGELLDLETQIAKYKNENGAALPDSYQYRLTELSALEQRRFELEQRRVQLEQQRRMLENGASILPVARLSPEQRQLAELRRTLIQKRSVLAESHPEIVALKASISALEASLKQGGASGAPDDQAPDAAEAGQSTVEIQAQVGLIDRELKLITEQREDSAARMEELRASLAKTPNVEMALNAYQRRYQNLQAQYDTAVHKLAEAETGRRLEVNRQAERFEVIEQAQVPAAPVAPNRLVIAGGGVAGSLMLGFVLALAIEMTNPAIRTSADLQRRLQLRPVIAVPYIRTRGERRRMALKWTIRIVLVVGGLAVLLWAIDQYVTPLSVLWEHALERSGFDDLMHMIRMRLV